MGIVPLVRQGEHGMGVGVHVSGVAEQAVAVVAVGAGVQAGEHTGGVALMGCSHGRVGSPRGR